MKFLLVVLILLGIFVLLSVGFIVGQGASTLKLPILFPTPKITLTPTDAPVPHLDPYKIYNLINDYRDSKGLSKLFWDPSMCDYTKMRLTQIHTDWSHRGYLVKYPPYQNQNDYAGENLAKDQDTEQEVISEWLNSQEHLANIEKAVYDRTCIATDTVGNETYTVQEFVSN